MAWVWPIASAIIGAIASKHNTDKQEESTRDLRGMELQNMKDLGPWAKQFLQQGAGAVTPAMNYYQRLLSGNRQDMMQAVAPEINSMNAQSTGLVNAQREMMPRGGMSTAQTSMIPWQNRGAINNLLFSVRPQAASALGQLGGNMISQGLGAMGLGSGMTNSMLNYGLNARQQNFDQGQSIGSAFGGAYQNYLLSQMMNNNNPSAKLPAYGNNSGNSSMPGE